MKFEIKSRWNGSVIFTAEIEATDETPFGIKLGLAVKKAVETDAVLTRAVLTGANLTGADLTDANLTGANLTGANLTGANLTDADLRSFKSDLWMILTQNRNEVPGLIAALREGRIDGSTYAGSCACLVGTIANVRGVSVFSSEMERDASRPAERWFLMIREGDKPGDVTGGGFAAGKAIEWSLEWCQLNGVTVPDAPTAEPAAA